MPLVFADLDPQRAPVLDGSPTQALLDLRRHTREGAALVILGADLAADRALEDPRAAFDDASGGDDDERTRVIGPASGGMVRGPGRIALISAIGPLFPRIASALGAELGLAVDLGLGWDVGAHELLEAIADSGPTIDTIGLALRPDQHRALTPALRRVQGRRAVFAYARGELADALGLFGVACVPDLGALVRALATRPDDRPRGRRVAVVTSTGPLAALVEPAFEAAGLTLARPTQATIDHLVSELPARTVTDPIVQIPGATARHVEVALESLRSDLRAEHVLAFDLPGHPARDPAIEAAHLVTLATASRALAGGASRLPEDPPGSLRAEALVAAAVLMRQTTIDRDTTLALFAELAPDVDRASAFLVASLATARHAARTFGYPVMLDHTVLADEAALAAHWEALVARLAPSDDPRPSALRALDPFAARVLRRAPATVITLAYAAAPLPHVTISDRRVGLPARAADVPDAALAPVIAALSRLAVRLPEVATVELVVGANPGHGLAIIDCTATLVAADPR